MTVVCYPSPGKRKALKLCTAFAKGARGGVGLVGQSTLIKNAPAFFYGLTDHTVPLINQCAREGREWYYADNAYHFGRGEYFRITRNARMHDGLGEPQRDRLAEFGVNIKPWRRSGSKILVILQSDVYHGYLTGGTAAKWADRIFAELRNHTKRTVAICPKPHPRMVHKEISAFDHCLDDAWAVVGFDSSTMVKALVAGVPVISLGQSMASSMGRASLADIEDPLYPDDRERWLNVLLCNQWTYDEMGDGTIWRALHEND
jgi:hypothetical protein